MKKRIEEDFIRHFGHEPQKIIFSPGRANIIGEHTDYNEGFVLPFAIHLGIWFAFRANDSKQFNIISYNQKEKFSFSDLQETPETQSGWKNFILQVFKVLDFDVTQGLDLVFGGNLPIGAGVSSSSALTCGWVTVLLMSHHIDLNAEHILRLAVSAERGYGVEGGIMDQYTIINGQKNHAILLDCYDNTAKDIKIPSQGFCFYLIDTRVKHNLIETDYNQRRKECHQAVELLKQKNTDIKSLRNATIEDIDVLKNHPLLHKRALYVLQENERVLNAIKAIQNKDIKALGTLLYASHHGLSHSYEVSCTELDWLVEYSKTTQEIIGARMMGGGFGGCTINLTSHPLSQKCIQNLKDAYFKKFGIQPYIFEVKPENGILAAMD